jgi:hypothetical protein
LLLTFLTAAGAGAAFFLGACNINKGILSLGDHQHNGADAKSAWRAGSIQLAATHHLNCSTRDDYLGERTETGAGLGKVLAPSVLCCRTTKNWRASNQQARLLCCPKCFLSHFFVISHAFAGKAAATAQPRLLQVVASPAQQTKLHNELVTGAS